MQILAPNRHLKAQLLLTAAAIQPGIGWALSRSGEISGADRDHPGLEIKQPELQGLGHDLPGKAMPTHPRLTLNMVNAPREWPGSAGHRRDIGNGRLHQLQQSRRDRLGAGGPAHLIGNHPQPPTFPC